MSGQDMQTVVSYSDLIEDHLDQNLANDSGYDCERSPDTKIIVDEDDKELIIADEESLNVDIDEDNNSHDSEKKEEIFEPSWHPHVYGKPPKKPTPHTIEYILGIKKVSQLMSVKRNFQEKSVQVEDRKFQVDDRKFQVDNRKFQGDDRKLNKNRLQEQLLQRVRTSESELDKVYGFKEDQPLNLSVPKSKDSWPDEKNNCKGKDNICFFFNFD